MLLALQARSPALIARGWSKHHPGCPFRKGSGGGPSSCLSLFLWSLSGTLSVTLRPLSRNITEHLVCLDRQTSSLQSMLSAASSGHMCAIVGATGEGEMFGPSQEP